MQNLFKSIVELSFPNMAKYLFWACDQNQGIFEPLNEEDFFKYKRMSKYKKDEIAANKQNNQIDSSTILQQNQQMETGS